MRLIVAVLSMMMLSSNFVYSEGGKEWGPAVTIPLFLTGNHSLKMELTEAQGIIENLNEKANTTFSTKNADDIITGRFRDFTLIPLKSLLNTGNDQSAVMDESKLEEIEVDGQRVKLWDESQMRKNLFPHVDAFYLPNSKNH